MAMPSETRHAYWKSGDLPSQVKSGYNAIGPIPGSGAMPYINYTPSYLPDKKGAAPAVAGSSGTFSGAGSIRYSSPAAPSPTLVTSQRINTSVAPSMVSNSAVGSIRYTR
jgi:hypothetical protein